MDTLNRLQTVKKVSERSLGGVQSNGEHWVLHGTGTCEHLLGHVPSFALINVGLDKRVRVCLREFQPGRRDEPGCQSLLEGTQLKSLFCCGIMIKRF